MDKVIGSHYLMPPTAASERTRMTPDHSAEQRSRRRAIAAWLFGICAMVFVMVVLGGLTRLTDSGLSMVDWRPITGWLPPMDAAAWERAFEAYRATPEYQKINRGMSLDEFQGIFWLEFVHRLWGRIIGVAFALPFAVFLLKGWVDRPLGLRLALLFVLGGGQGMLGWWMVKSGLIDRPDVSQYRLMAHLMLALVVMAYGLWTALALWHGAGRTEQSVTAQSAAAHRVRPLATGLLALVFVTAASGALVAGLDAGLTYNTFPLMDGEWLPAGLFEPPPAWRAAFEDVMTVQFDHRVLATATLIGVLTLAVLGRRWGLQGRAARALDWMAVMVVAQASLGIATLLLAVPISLAALHQAGAVVLLMLAVWLRRELADPA